MNKATKDLIDMYMLYTFKEIMSKCKENVNISTPTVWYHLAKLNINSYFHTQCYRWWLRKQRWKRMFEFGILEFKSADWDSRCIDGLISLKLKYIIQYMDKYAERCGKRRRIKQMKIARHLIDRIDKGYIHSDKEREALHAHVRSWKHISRGDGMTQLIMPHNPYTNSLHERANSVEAYDKEYLWKLLTKYYDEWAD